MRSRQLPAAAALLLVLLAAIFFAAIRYRLRDMPLERDEGEYAYSGQLLLQGIPPYKLAYNMKLPGTYVAYAVAMAAFGETSAGIHLGLLLLNAITVFLLYFLVSTLFDRLAAVAAACSYAALSTSQSVMGFEAHATNFVLLPALAGILLLLSAAENRRGSAGDPPAVERTSRPLSGPLLLLSGFLSGIAFLMKQHGIFFILFCLFYLTWSAWERKDSSQQILFKAALFLLGAMLPYLISCWLLYRAGVFTQFWFWTVSYANEYSKMGLRRAIHAFGENLTTVVRPALPLWILAAAGMSAPLWSQSARGCSVFVTGLFLFSFLSLCPGAYFRPHYFILLLPAIAILAGVAVSATTEKLAQHFRAGPILLIPALALLASFSYAIFRQRQIYFFKSPVEAVQATYGGNAFVPALEIAGYIRNHSPESARIAVIGSEPEICFYAHRHSATGYIYMYSLIGPQKYTSPMRAEFVRELEQNRPEFLVYVDIWDSWGEREGSPQAAGFLTWLQNYMGENYERVGVADIRDTTEYVWGTLAGSYSPKSNKVIYVLKRKSVEIRRGALSRPFQPQSIVRAHAGNAMLKRTSSDLN
ncbi:MAG: glycosyltransferase family 39 protein [Candidatus Sulfotelmatobacter sp.]